MSATRRAGAGSTDGRREVPGLKPSLDDSACAGPSPRAGVTEPHLPPDGQRQVVSPDAPRRAPAGRPRCDGLLQRANLLLRRDRRSALGKSRQRSLRDREVSGVDPGWPGVASCGRAGAVGPRLLSAAAFEASYFPDRVSRTSRSNFTRPVATSRRARTGGLFFEVSSRGPGAGHQLAGALGPQQHQARTGCPRAAGSPRR